LINFLLEEKLSIVNSKSQTTRQNIKGFIHGEHHQMILVDTPGFIDEPAYQLQLNMNSYIELALEEADIVVLVVDKYNLLDPNHPLIKEVLRVSKKTFLVVNKVDQCSPEEVKKLISHYESFLKPDEIVCVSVELKLGKAGLTDLLLKYLPVHPLYYDHNDWTDRNMRFFASEIIREKIFSSYQKEIPYSTEVVIDKYSEKSSGESIIEAIVYVERESQKAILIGHQAERIKKISADSRAEIESYTGTKIHLFIFVKVLEDWRSKDKILEKFGYFNPKKIDKK
jgi:GTP-binding protein Era